MIRKLHLLAGLIALAFLIPTLGQQTTDTEQLKRDFKDKLCQTREDELKSCQQENSRLKAEIDDLKDDDRSPVSFAQMMGYGTGFGLGISIIVVLVLFWKRLKPPAPKKQLAALVFCAIWIVATGLIMESDSALSKHPINLLVSIFVYSLPALLVTGITLWWLKRTKPDVIKLW